MELRTKTIIAKFINHVAAETAAQLDAGELAGEFERGRAGERYKGQPPRAVFSCALALVLERTPADDELDYALAEWRETYGSAVARTA